MGEQDVVLVYYVINTRLEDFVEHQCNYLNGKGRMF
jgi:hypothetical protein